MQKKYMAFIEFQNTDIENVHQEGLFFLKSALSGPTITNIFMNPRLIPMQGWAIKTMDVQ